MDQLEAVRALAALANENRLALYRRLVEAGDAGVTAGELSAAAGVGATNLSFHAKELERAGLVSHAREGRFIRYRISVGAMRELLAFLTEDCCGGHPEICGLGGAAETKPCCEPKGQPVKGVAHGARR